MLLNYEDDSHVALFASNASVHRGLGGERSDREFEEEKHGVLQSKPQVFTVNPESPIQINGLEVQGHGTWAWY